MPNVNSIQSLVSKIISQYDLNGSGAIGMGIGGEADGRDETRRVESTVSGGMGIDSVVLTTSVHSNWRLFMHADVNNDWKVTREELTNAIKAYDVNGDGVINTRRRSLLRRRDEGPQEMDRFLEDFGERTITSRQSGL